MPPTPTESLTNSIDSCRLSWPILLTPQDVWLILPTLKEGFTNASHFFWKFDQSHPVMKTLLTNPVHSAGSLMNPTLSQRNLDKSFPLAQKKKKLINAVHSNRMFDQSLSLLQTFLTNCVWWCIKSYQSCPLSQSFTSPSNSHRHSWTYLAIAKFEQSQPHP